MKIALLTRDNTMLNTIAQRIPSTLKPGTILETINTIRALITKVNNPRVNMLIGNVRKRTNGFIKRLTTASNIATASAVTNPSTLTPGNM